MNLSQLLPEHISEYALVGATYGYYIDEHGALPHTYLEYARQDRNAGDESRHLVNAVGNAKRAFHRQTEMLCDAFGWKVTNKRSGNFGAYLDYLGRCGVVSPNILRKLNATRNRVEHGYVFPEPEQVDDYLDIVELFLMATRGLLDRFPEYTEYERMKDEDFDPALQLPDDLIIQIAMKQGGMKIRSAGVERVFAMGHDEYYLWMSAVIRHYVL